MGKSYREVLSRASSFLEAEGKEGYSIQFLFLERKHWSKTDWLLQMNTAILPEDEAQIEADVQALLADYPPQYLLGEAEFYGRTFHVTQHTLIPRPETEELVQLCLEKTSSEPQRVVDVGTGTGAIAVTLKLERPQWQIAAVDISPEALTVAKQNAAQLAADVVFTESDVLDAQLAETYDIIIANPPYISHSEWELMDASVRKFEPKQALFADEEGLAVYRKIAHQAPQVLAAKGKLFLEIGYAQGAAVKQLFTQAFPEKQVRCHKDMFGQDRMIVVE